MPSVLHFPLGDEMTKQLLKNTSVFLLLAMIAVLLLPGCGKKQEEEKPVVSDAQALNEYSSDNVFVQVYRQVQAEPDNVDALYHLADLYDRQGQYQKAVDTFKKVLELNPNRNFAYFKLGTAYSRLNQNEKAVEALKEAAKHLPHNPIVMNNLGIAYGKLNRLDDEIAAFKKALEIRPRYASGRFNLALVYLKKGDRQSAMEQYEELEKFDLTMAAELKKRIGAVK